MFGIPYLISAICSPFLGKIIDRVGRRALFITISSALLIVAYVVSASLPATDGSKLEIIPLVIVGTAYSVYCAAIWGSIPYTVSPHTVGTAFGICTAIQNIGLVIAPTVVGWLKTHTSRGYGYFWVLMFFVAVNILGFACNAYLYFIDIKYYEGVLNNVEAGDKIEDLMTSPIKARKELLTESKLKSRARQSLMDYKLDRSSRMNLKKSIASHTK
jgi:MFS family permease